MNSTKNTPEKQDEKPHRIGWVTDTIFVVTQSENSAAFKSAGGIFWTHEEIESLIKKIARFYDTVTPEEIYQRNTAVFEDLFSHSTHTPPQSKPKPKPGCVYVILAEKTGLYKIGHTDNPDRRLKQLQRNSPDILDYAITISTDDALTKEKRLHEKYADKRVNGEWFKLTPEDVQSIWENR